MVSVWWWPYRMSLGVFISLHFFGNGFGRISVNSSLSDRISLWCHLVLDFCLLEVYISLWFSLRRLCLCKNLSISSRLSTLLAYSCFLVVFYDPLYFSGVYCYFSFLIFNFVDLSSFFLKNLAEGLSVLFVFSKNQLFVSLILLILFVYISALIFLSFLLLTLGFVYSFFSVGFRHKIRLFICDFSCFLR